ncbi:hypothetical protein ACG94X_03555 [Acinetobacter sp. ULE_I010]|uniref:hypothetical protein n=1 Tax=Acinetobacter sp. ULE_I010 TaxID=3373065 RepID=UPI003AF908AF
MIQQLNKAFAIILKISKEDQPMNCSPQQQYQFFKTFTENKRDHLDNIILKYKYDLVDIDGVFHAIRADDKGGIQPAFICIEGNHIGLNHDIDVLSFYQNRLTTGEQALFSRNKDAIYPESSLTQLYKVITKLTENATDLATMYFRIRFNFEADRFGSNTISISLEQFICMVKMINGIVKNVEPNDSSLDIWEKVPVMKIRSELYSYAQSHPEIEKIWFSIFSTGLFAFFKSNNPNHNTEIKDQILKIVQPYLDAYALFIVDTIEELFTYIEDENQEAFKQQALLFDTKNWHFGLLKWFRIRAKTLFIDTE